MDLRDYMAALKDRGFKNCGDLKYNQNDKDMGYRSGLRFLGMNQSPETDAIANEMIYGAQHVAKKEQKKESKDAPNFKCVQMQLFA